MEKISPTPPIEVEGKELEQSTSISTRTLFNAKRLAKRLGDPKPHFMLWALQHLPESRIESLVSIALERGNRPAAYFNKLVTSELDKQT